MISLRDAGWRRAGSPGPSRAWRMKPGWRRPSVARFMRPSSPMSTAFRTHRNRRGVRKMRLLLHWLANALALLALAHISSMIQVDSFVTALIVALVLGLVNTL